MKFTSIPLLRPGRASLTTGTVLAALVHLGAHAVPPVPPVMTLPAGPVSLTLVRPNVLLDLSVEYPTAGSAYKNAYSKDRRYFGYFDPSTCYKYQGGNATYSGGVYNTANDANKYLFPTGRRRLPSLNAAGNLVATG